MLLYLECSSGASGDMVLAALIDAGAEIEPIRKQLSRIDLPIEIATEEVTRAGIRGLHLRVSAGLTSVGSYAGAVRLIEEAALDEPVAQPALAILHRLVEAEAHVHGESQDDVNFHELDASDTIVDVVGVAAAIAWLEVDRVICSPVATGTGFITTEHGTLPNPAPTVLELLEGAPLYSRPIEAELITPTGAAIIAHFAGEFGNMPLMKISRTGYGAGTRDLETPNLLRAILGEAAETSVDKAEAVLIEANIDDMNPELYEYVMERLFQAGASDVWLVPAIGKSGRPMNTLTVLAPSNIEESVRDIVLDETSSLGLRTTLVEKWMSERISIEVRVQGQTIRVKIGKRAGRVANIAPEYADCAEAARSTGLPIKQIFHQATLEASRTLGL